jgi:hypothetical protein
MKHSVAFEQARLSDPSGSTGDRAFTVSLLRSERCHAVYLWDGDGDLATRATLDPNGFRGDPR